jgi:hypothetical protein
MKPFNIPRTGQSRTGPKSITRPFHEWTRLPQQAGTFGGLIIARVVSKARSAGTDSADAFLARTAWSVAFLVEQARDWLQSRRLHDGECNALIRDGRSSTPS